MIDFFFNINHTKWSVYFMKNTLLKNELLLIIDMY